MAIENWVSRHLEDLIEVRHDLHRNPELLYDVEQTSDRVAKALTEAGVDEVVRGLGRTGVVGVIRGNRDTSGRIIGLRADMVRREDRFPARQVRLLRTGAIMRESVSRWSLGVG